MIGFWIILTAGFGLLAGSCFLSMWFLTERIHGHKLLLALDTEKIPSYIDKNTTKINMYKLFFVVFLILFVISLSCMIYDICTYGILLAKI